MSIDMTNITDYHDKAIVGMTGDSQIRNVVTNPAASAIPFGNVVAIDANENVRNMVAPIGTQVIWGIAKYNMVLGDTPVSHTSPTQADFAGGTAPAATVAQYRAGQAVNVIRQGTVYVKLDGAATVGTPVYVSAVSAGSVEHRYTSSNATGNILIPSARFKESGVSGDIVMIEINLP